jgi:hypothetical protein
MHPVWYLPAAEYEVGRTGPCGRSPSYGPRRRECEAAYCTRRPMVSTCSRGSPWAMVEVVVTIGKALQSENRHPRAAGRAAGAEPPDVRPHANYHRYPD